MTSARVPGEVICQQAPYKGRRPENYRVRTLDLDLPHKIEPLEPLFSGLAAQTICLKFSYSAILSLISKQ
jgi:hypothetical protein